MMEKVKLTNKLLVFAAVFLIALSMAVASLWGGGYSAAAGVYPEGDLDELDFTIDTGDYVRGICATSGNLPTVTLTLTGENIKASQTEFWYCERETIGLPEADDTWKKLNDINKADDFAALEADYLVQDNEFYAKYIYFKTVIAKQNPDNPASTDYYEYINPNFVDLIVDRTIDSQSYEISAITTEYLTSQGIYQTYNTDNPTWVSTSIRFTISSTNISQDNKNFYFSFSKLPDGSDEWLPATVIEQSGSYYAQVVIQETYRGQVKFRSTDRSSGIVNSYDGHRYIMLDTNIPAFSVKAEKDIPGGSETERRYVTGQYSHTDVMYTVTPVIPDETPDESRAGSGATYWYYTGEYNSGERVWNRMTAVNGIYTLVITQTTNTLEFKGVSNAGKDSSKEGGVSINYRTYIDKVKPKINLSAFDGKGSAVRSLGASEGAGYKVGYASDLINFRLTNGSINESKVTFEYMIDNGGADNYIEASSAALYEKVFDTSFINRKFKFRARSEAGLYDIVEFTVSVLFSNYSFELYREINFNTNAAGWAKYIIPVYLKVPAVIDNDGEYDFYTQITNNASSSKKMDSERTEVITGGDGKLYSIYRIYIDRSLNNQNMDFYAYNRAGDKSATITTAKPIKLDLLDPDGSVVKKIYNSSVELEEEDWANGRVVISITPTTDNKSGIKCYPLLGGQRGREIFLTNGVFSYQATVTGAYSFILVSGADRSKVITVNIKIDTSDILFNGMTATVEEIAFDQEGNEYVTDKSLELVQNGDYYTVNSIVSSDVTVDFLTNHSGHFTYYYQKYTGAVPDASSYIHVTDRSNFVIPISQFESIDNSTVKYAFYLESRAVNADGMKKTTRIRYINVSYNIKNFTIAIEYYLSGDDWTSNDIEFVINSRQSDESSVAIGQYQMKLVSHDGTDYGWKNITPDVTVEDLEEPYKATYIFGGMEQIDVASGRVLGYAFHGKLYFRAVNTAGRMSPVVGDEIKVKLDKTTPDPVHAIKQSPGGQIVTGIEQTNLNDFIVYSNTTINLVPTNNNSQKPVFGSLSPITYYYCSDVGYASAPDVNDPNFRTLTAATPVTGSYYMYARNQLNATSPVYKFRFMVETKAPTATLSASDAAIGVAGIYEFNWKDVAIVNINVISETFVYYWYKIGANGAWLKYNAQAEEAGGIKDIVFVGKDDPRYPSAIVGNMDQTVQFKVTNLAGSTATFTADALVRIRIDVRKPEFDFETTCLGEVINRTEWQSSEIFIRIFPAEKVDDGSGNEILVPIDPLTANPGGVTYQYTFDRLKGFEQLPGDGTFFSTDDLATAIAGGAGFDGNGEITIYFKATAKESDVDPVEKSLTLYIDKVVPLFELVGEITIPGTANTQKITSGTWTQADEVRISKVIGAVSKSPVSYVYYTNDDDYNASPWDDNRPVNIKEICTLHVTATSASGIVVNRSFDIKIDNEAPLINSGIIRNAVIVNPDGSESIDRLHPNTYYIDQIITYIEPNLSYAVFNNFNLSNGYIIATNTVDNSNTGNIPGGKGGYVHIIVEDYAGNRSELIFYMTEFELTINTITLSQEHKDLLEKYEEQFEEGKFGLTEARRAHFQTSITRLRDRLSTLQKQVDEYRAYLLEINNKSLFTLLDDYTKMSTYINYFETNDETILYPEWQQIMIKQGDYGLYYAKMENEHKKLKALAATVQSVEKQVAALPAVNVVTREDYPKIVRVYNSYESMLNTQKEYFSSNLNVKLVELKRSCEILLLQDISTGIKIEGDDLAPGVAIEVVSYEKTTEYVNNAQLTLLETMPEGTPRAIVYVKKLTLSDFGSQYSTGEITVTLPIPTEFQNYIQFAVYKLSSDGTVIPIDGININADGKSLSFSANSLDTYILAVGAQPTIRPPSQEIYGSIGDIKIDAVLLSYITYAACGLFGIMLVIVLIVGIRHKGFLARYNKANKRSLVGRGINKIPKGNRPSRSNPATVGEKLKYDRRIYKK